ncbi:hypothetical protein D3C71_1382390 [compost metagenome]
MDDDAAVFVDLHDHGRAVPVADGAVAAHVHGRGHAHAAAFRAARRSRFARLAPAQRARRLVDALDEAGARDLPAVHRHLAGADGVLLVDLGRIEPELHRHRVDVAVEREQHLRAAEAAEGPVRRRVGIDHGGVRAHVLQAVHVVAAHGAHVHHLGGQARIGAAVRDDAHVLRNNQAVTRHAELERDALGNARGAGQEIFEPVVDQAHRLAGLHREQAGDQLVRIFDDLAAEAAAGGRLDHADGGHRPFQRRG